MECLQYREENAPKTYFRSVLIKLAARVFEQVEKDTVFSFIMGYSSNIWQTNLQKKKD
jgi:hypothetical protein